MDKDSQKFFADLAGAESDEPKTLKITEEDGDESADSETVVPKEKKVKEKKEEVEINKDIFEESEGQLTIDVYQNPDEIVVESTIAGVKPEDLDVAITSEAVTIRGKREKQEIVKDENYFYQECYWGKFSRSIILPQEIDSDKAAASLKNGILTIRLPKLNRSKAKKLKVKFD